MEACRKDLSELQEEKDAAIEEFLEDHTDERMTS